MRLFLLVAGLAATTSSLANDSFFGPLYVDGGYQHQVEGRDKLEGSGYDAGASLEVGDYFWVGGSYSNVRTEPFTRDDGATGRLEYESSGGSIGGFLPLSDWGGASAGVGYTFANTISLDGFAGEPDEKSEGVTGSFGLHFDLMRWVDLSLGRSYSYIGGERAWDASIGLSLLAWRGVWLDTSYWIADDVEGWTGGMRVRFGR